MLSFKLERTHFLLFFLITSFLFSCQSGRNSSEYELVLSNDWQIQSSSDVKASGDMISTAGFDAAQWLPTSVPTTVLAALVENGVYKDPYFGKNMTKIPTQQFEKAWWYRTEFNLTEEKVSKNVRLKFEGINYKADIWLNGQQLATSEKAEGAFRHFEFDVTKTLKKGKNALAVEVIPPVPGQFSIGFVDWNPIPPDNNMGIWRNVILHFNDGVSIENPYVISDINLETLTEASLTITAELVNHKDVDVTGKLTGHIESIEISKDVSLSPGERQLVTFNPEDYKELNISNPRLWWPNNLGQPNLYKLDLSFTTENNVTDQESVTFGIREISDYFNEAGHRGYKVNGHKVLIKGGGSVDDLMLADTYESIEAKIKYTKHMNLNTIRLEGFWGKDHTIYDLCDQNGIMIMIGWSCHWEWEEYLGKACDEKYGGILTPEEIDLMSQSWQDQVIWLRNHPSIFLWMLASDKLPHPDLERKYHETFAKYEPTRPFLSSAGGAGSEDVTGAPATESVISGPTGVKMLGPYAYTPPVYWFTDTKFGGAYGFNTETGPGPQIPPLESVKKMIPEDHLWPIDDYWNFHCGRNEFVRLDRYQKAIDMRFGKSDNVEEFVKKAQVINYELMRPHFEAFSAYRYNATGLIQWMLNSSWPEMYWQLFDSYLMPNGAFYGAKKAAQPIHILYRYGFDDIYFVNELFKPLDNMTAKIRILDINSKELFNKTIDINIGENMAKQIFELPKLDNLSTTYFLDLRLYDAENNEIDNNFYWLSTHKDELDYEAKVEDWYYYTPSKAYADLTALNDLPKVQLDVQHHFESDGDKQKVYVELENSNDSIAFFVEMRVVGDKSGSSILPVFWQDNYISLLPGEKQKYMATFDKKDLKNEKPELSVTGWNVM